MARRSRLPPKREHMEIDSGLATVNIVLLLIFFFLITGSISPLQDIKVILPDTTTLPLDQLPKPLLVVAADGSLTFDGMPIARGELAAAMVDFPTLHVIADRQGNAGALLDILADENLIAVQVRLVTVHRKTTGDSK